MIASCVVGAYANAATALELCQICLFHMSCCLSNVLILQDVLRAPELAQGQKLASRNQAHVLVMQHDGNLVHYNGGGAVWSSETGGKGSGPYYLVLQDDSNAVVYGQGGSVIWATNTNGRGSAPARFVMQDDGNIVMYDANGKVIWARF